MNRNIVDTLTLNEYIPLRRLLQSGQHPKQGGLTAARRSKKCHQAALFDIKIHFFDSNDIAETFIDAFELHHGLLLVPFQCNDLPG